MESIRLESIRSLGRVVFWGLVVCSLLAPSAAFAAGLEHKLLAPVIKASALARSSASVAARAADAPNVQYDFVSIDAPGAVATAAYGINDAGLISGYFFDASFNFHGWVQQPRGAPRVDDYPQALDTVLGDPNNAGIVIGNFGDAAQHAVLLDAETGKWSLLPDIPDLPINLGDGINSRGTGTGVACAGNFVAVIFLNCVSWTWNGRAYSFLQHPDASVANGGTTANGINDRNQVAGYFTDANAINHGFVKDGDDFSTIDAPGATNTFVFDINDRGEVVGYYLDQSGIFHGLVERNGNFATVDFPSAIQTQILGNDARGDLAGTWVDVNLVQHGFVALKRDSDSQ